MKKDLKQGIEVIKGSFAAQPHLHHRSTGLHHWFKITGKRMDVKSFYSFEKKKADPHYPSKAPPRGKPRWELPTGETSPRALELRRLSRGFQASSQTMVATPSFSDTYLSPNMMIMLAF